MSTTRKWQVTIELVDNAPTERYALTDYTIAELVRDNVEPELPDHVELRILSIKEVRT